MENRNLQTHDCASHVYDLKTRSSVFDMIYFSKMSRLPAGMSSLSIYLVIHEKNHLKIVSIYNY